MTKVTFREYYDKNLIIIEGHSGYGSFGNDVACAGVSTLAFTLLNMLLDEEAEGSLKLLRNVVRDGYICFEIETAKASKERIQGALDTVFTGFSMLSEAYPQNIKIE